MSSHPHCWTPSAFPRRHLPSPLQSVVGAFAARSYRTCAAPANDSYSWVVPAAPTAPSPPRTHAHTHARTHPFPSLPFAIIGGGGGEEAAALNSSAANALRFGAVSSARIAAAVPSPPTPVPSSALAVYLMAWYPSDVLLGGSLRSTKRMTATGSPSTTTK